jgi:hypothetical protein
MLPRLAKHIADAMIAMLCGVVVMTIKLNVAYSEVSVSIIVRKQRQNVVTSTCNRIGRNLYY